MAGKLLVALVILCAAVAYQVFDPGRWISLQGLRDHADRLQDLVAARPLLVGGGFFALYVLATALSLPIAAVLTLGAGLLFGFGWGLLLVSFASSIGATLAFLVARYLLRDALRRRFGQRIDRLDAGIRRDGAFSLFTLRMIPVVPFWLVNLGMGLTTIRTWTFYWVSQLAMLLGTAIYVNAGTRLADVDGLGDVLSPSVIGSLVLLGLFPLLARKSIALLRSRRALRGHRPPRHADYNVIVIGAGAGGLVASSIAAAVKAKVALIERERMGGDCLNTGCVPSKALIRSARFFHDVARGAAFGAARASAEVDFAAVMERVQATIRRIEPHDSAERYTRLGVDCIAGTARIVDPYTVEVAGRRLSTRHIVIATGARPRLPEVPGVDEVELLTSHTLWSLRELPRRLVVVGGGPIGCELAQAFRRLGSGVVQVESGERLLAKEDPDIVDWLARRFRDEGIEVRTGHRVCAFRREGDEQVVVCSTADGAVELRCDRILVALGRSPNVSGFGLEELGVRLAEAGTVEVDPFLRTTLPNIFAIGDVAGPHQFTHFAAHQAWHAAVNALFAPFVRRRADYRVLPWCTYTDPEIAHLGLGEQAAREQGVDYRVVRYPLQGQDRAITEGEAYGEVKVLTPPGRDTILGATIVGPHAGELIAELGLAMRHGLGLNRILATVHAYPTLAEANKGVAGAWQLANQPRRVLGLLRRYHAWRRSRLAGRLLFGGILLLVLLLLALLIAGWRFAVAS